MTAVAATLGCFAAYVVGYRFYARHLARHVFELDSDAPTPAHTLRDGYDYVPCRRSVLFGHHYASIAGLSPMLGPAIAVIWGWLPAMLWVVFGTLLIGAVHDFSALVVSMRARGMSIGKVAEDVIGPRAKSLFHCLIFFLVALAMGVFVQVVAQLFSPAFYPEAVLPSGTLMVLAVAMGLLVYRHGFPLTPLTVAGFLLSLASIYVSLHVPALQWSPATWNYVLLGYAFAASILPVWLLLQPRDYLNSLLLYLGLGLIFTGFLVLRPEFVAPAIDPAPAGAPPIFPFVFIVIACGAVSGFHGLVSSGTTAKQIDKETDAPMIGYGGMIGESLLGLAAVLACTAGFATVDAWHEHYATWTSADGLGTKLSAFVVGSARFLATLGVPEAAGQAFIALVAASFALTTLDSATRLLRFNIQEVSETLRLPALGNRYVASLLAVAAIGFFSSYRIDGRPAGLALWGLFGTTNQVMGGLTLLAVTLYLLRRGSNYWFTLVPMVFLLGTTVIAMVINVRDFYRDGSYLLMSVGGFLLVLALWLTVEGAVRFRQLREAAA